MFPLLSLSQNKCDFFSVANRRVRISSHIYLIFVCVIASLPPVVPQNILHLFQIIYKLKPAKVKVDSKTRREEHPVGCFESR